MSTLKAVKCQYEVYVGSNVLVYHNVEGNFDFAKITDELLTKEQHEKTKSGPSYSYNNVTTYYVGCGTVTRMSENIDNPKCWVKLAY